MPSCCSSCSTLCTPLVNPEAGLADHCPDLRRLQCGGDVRSRATGAPPAVAVRPGLTETTAGPGRVGGARGAGRPSPSTSRWCRKRSPSRRTTTRSTCGVCGRRRTSRACRRRCVDALTHDRRSSERGDVARTTLAADAPALSDVAATSNGQGSPLAVNPAAIAVRLRAGRRDAPARVNMPVPVSCQLIGKTRGRQSWKDASVAWVNRRKPLLRMPSTSTSRKRTFGWRDRSRSTRCWCPTNETAEAGVGTSGWMSARKSQGW